MLDPRLVFVGIMIYKEKIFKYLIFQLSVTVPPMLNINIISLIYDSIN
jgi:hypothetical protein